MKCIQCRGKAVIELRQHNSAFCRDHFFEYFERQVQRTIEKFRMFGPQDRILVAVSGGKDSLVLWDVLLRFGYQADGLYVDLGIGDYSPASGEKARAFAEARQAKLHCVGLGRAYGFTVPEASARLRRVPCSPCGLSKRYVFNRFAREQGYDVVATGHNLDDEAAVLLGNLLHWNEGYLARQYPVLEAHEDGFVRKVKPLVRLTERETAAYAVLRGVDYIVEECPFSRGAQSILYKEALNKLESESPGTKRQLLFGFYERARERFRSAADAALHPCARCGQPTTSEVCAFCRMSERLVPVTQGR